MEHLDAVVVGMGPGGEAVASRLLAEGRHVAVAEADLIGGECGYYACIPTKVLLRGPEAQREADGVAGLSRPELDWEALRSYRDGMIRHLDDSAQVDGYRDLGARVFKGRARLVGRDPWRVVVNGTELQADHVVLATGSEPVVPPIAGLAELGPDVVWTNREATTLTAIPERAVVVGGSAVGVELGQFLAELGSRVTVVQRGPRLLDREDERLCALVSEQFERDGIDVRTGTQVSAVGRDAHGVVAHLDDGTRVETDVVVLASGRRPRVEGLGLDEVGVDTGGGAVAVDDRCRLAPGLWAVGDLTGQAMFTHVASYQARVVTDNLLGTDHRADYTGVPRVVFSHPEVAAVGLTQEQARGAGVDVVASEVDLTEELARPWTFETEPQGRLGLVADRASGVLVGAWAFGPLSSEWIHTAALAVRARIPVSTLRRSIFQFPTFSQGYLAALDRLEM
ncbi:NAD(P)/FAD-dependent oxidoreductase [Nocardiopsis sp. HNM0947]|uniref:NAD(P)/FAD-dependent oxidoreductase n=1 Tax=Nocardiopsis coralli TaxID=2772213 RepID=A0ABR9PCJ5_9ACTN|nr:NAD(P)/FAD-dependent oxidoreductase [Nocardiopsis coralli]MBE3001567.1 NAD(P)/FAD-dependent oxidoreductase [Nocardiopsis coralli]